MDMRIPVSECKELVKPRHWTPNGATPP